MNEDKAPGQPNIIIQGPLRDEKVELDSNRISQQQETGWEFLQRLAIPATWEEICMQAQNYIFLGWFVVGLLLVAVDHALYPVAVIILLALVPSIYLAGWLSNRYKSARVFLRYRLLLLAIGGILFAPAPLTAWFEWLKSLFNR